MTPQDETRLADQLLAQGLLTTDQLSIAQAEQKRHPQALGKTLVHLGFVSEANITEIHSATLGHALVRLNDLLPDAQALRLIPREMARRHQILPLGFEQQGHTLLVAMSAPEDIVAHDQLQMLLKGNLAIEVRVAGENELKQAIDRCYGHELSLDRILAEIADGKLDEQGLHSSDAEYSQPIVRLIDAILADAVHRHASDLHFEPEERFMRLRYRIDGVLRQVRSVHISLWPAMLVRLKVLSKMNIAETRAPQDGRISRSFSGHRIDFRTAAHPVIWGENFVARVLDRQQAVVPLSSLGLPPKQLAELQQMLTRPEGMLLLTGPTGSGKTTTLYAVLSHLNHEGVNIMTLEDPVEQPLPRVRQTSVNESGKINFANGVRSLLRQDPDIILVGEIRDRETAEMALRAAMTGHQVFSTLHTNSACAVFARLHEIGVPDELMADNIIGVIAQRLLRALCPDCKRPYQANEDEARQLACSGTPTLYQAVGCPRCEHIGYRGRFAVMELLCMDEALDELLARRAPPHQIRQSARTRGFVPLAEAACQRVLAGDTSLAEVARVIDLGKRS